MRRAAGLLLGLILANGAGARDSLALGDSLLELKAQARACYLGLFKLYDAEYFRAPGADAGAARCVRVSYLRDFSAAALDQATREIFTELHGAQVVDLHRQTLDELALAYRAVRPGDRYTYCVAADNRGVLLRDGRSVIAFDSTDFAARFLQIWVRAEPGAGDPEWGFKPC